MFTKNYIAYQKCFFGVGDPSWDTVVDCGGTARSWYLPNSTGKNIGNAIKIAQCRTMQAAISGSSINLNYPGIYFGSGTTAPTKDDYNLESPITSGLSITMGEFLSSENGEGSYSYASSFILRNTTEEDITIREIGIFGQVVYGVNSPFYNYLVLFRRDVLPNPVTIQAGESKLVTYKITFNQSQ